MTSIAVIKQVMRFDKEKVNNTFIYELKLNTSRADSMASCTYETESTISRANTRIRNCSRASNRTRKNACGTAAAEALDLGSVSSPAISWTSGK